MDTRTAAYNRKAVLDTKRVPRLTTTADQLAAFSNMVTYRALAQMDLRTVLDLGIGQGRDANKYAALCAGCVVGLDLSELALERASARFRSRKLPFLALCQDIRYLGPVTKQYSSLVLHFVANYFDGRVGEIDALLAAAYRRLLPGGLFSIAYQDHQSLALAAGETWSSNDGTVCYTLQQDDAVLVNINNQIVSPENPIDPFNLSRSARQAGFEVVFNETFLESGRGPYTGDEVRLLYGTAWLDTRPPRELLSLYASYRALMLRRPLHSIP